MSGVAAMLSIDLSIHSYQRAESVSTRLVGNPGLNSARHPLLSDCLSSHSFNRLNPLSPAYISFLMLILLAFESIVLGVRTDFMGVSLPSTNSLFGFAKLAFWRTYTIYLGSIDRILL